MGASLDTLTAETRVSKKAHLKVAKMACLKVVDSGVLVVVPLAGESAAISEVEKVARSAARLEHASVYSWVARSADQSACKSVANWADSKAAL